MPEKLETIPEMLIAWADQVRKSTGKESGDVVWASLPDSIAKSLTPEARKQIEDANIVIGNLQ